MNRRIVFLFKMLLMLAMLMSNVPDQIRAKIHELYPKEAIIAIERDSRGYEIRLSNRVELEFNKYGNLVDIDQD